MVQFPPQEGESAILRSIQTNSGAHPAYFYRQMACFPLG